MMRAAGKQGATVVTAHDQDNARRGNGNGPRRSRPDAGHHPLVAQPHTDNEGPVAAAEAVAAQISTAEHSLGRPGRPLDRRSPFFLGMSAAAGVAVMVGLVDMVITVRDVLVLIGLALFLAIGLEPAVSLLARHKFPRWSAVLTVLVAALGVGGVPGGGDPPRWSSRAPSSSPKPPPSSFGCRVTIRCWVNSTTACTCSNACSGPSPGTPPVCSTVCWERVR